MDENQGSGEEKKSSDESSLKMEDNDHIEENDQMEENDHSSGISCKPLTLIRGCLQLVLSAVPFAALIIGAKYQYECPQQPLVPIYLLVVGVVILLLSVLSVLPCCAYFGNQSGIWGCLVALFFFGWFIAGNVWVYSIYEPNYNKTVDMHNYCNKTLYLFAFWFNNLFYILLGLVILRYCCIFILLCSDSKDDSSPTDQAVNDESNQC